MLCCRAATAYRIKELRSYGVKPNALLQSGDNLVNLSTYPLVNLLTHKLINLPSR